MSDRPHLILQVSHVSARTQFIERNEAHIASLPIDGMVINTPESYAAMQPGHRVDRAELERWLEPLETFDDGRENYFLIHVDAPGGLFDDEAWAVVAENWRIIAEEAREAGFAGLVFDNEEYALRWQNFPEDHPGADPADLGLWQKQASVRGRQIAETTAEVFPEAIIGVMHGPYLSVDGGPDQPRAIEAQAGGADGHELRGPFFFGLLEGLGADQTLVDMGELYQLRGDREFADSQAYRSDTLPQLVDWRVPDELRENWDTHVDQSHIVFPGEFP